SAIRKNYRKILMAFAIILNILVLAYFKYAYFFTNSFNELFHTNHQVFNSISYFKNGFSTVGEYSIFDKLILPAGVSFFTFSSIAYIIDVYRKETVAVRHFFHFSF